MSTAPLCVPAEPLFKELFQGWERDPQRIVIRDLSASSPDVSTETFLYDVLALRIQLYESLSEQAKKALRDPNADDVFIAVLARPGYEFAVLCYTIYSIGAVIVPLSPDVLLEEARYFLELCNASLLTSGVAEAGHSQAISNQVGVRSLTFDPSQSVRPVNPTFVQNTGDGSGLTSPNKGFVLLYTSGTTGSPKGVLHSRQGAFAGIQSQKDKLGVSPRGTCLIHSPVHWIAGFLQFFVAMLAGTRVEFCPGVFSPDWLLERMSSGDVSCLWLGPSVLDAVQEKLHIAENTWSRAKYDSVVTGFSRLCVLYTGAMPVGPARKKFWKAIRGGKPLVEVYGLTEQLSLVCSTSWESDDKTPLGSCGTPSAIVELKLSDDGELLLKTPALFTKYLSPNPDMMQGVFDRDGFYKTGDLARLEGNYVFVGGRASQDVIRFSGWKVFAPELECALSTHPLVLRAVILGVSDAHTGQRVAALIQSKENNRGDTLNLAEIRRWLFQEQNVLAYKLPTVLRVLESTQKFPMTSSGKPIKPKIRETLFEKADPADDGSVEVWDLARKEPGVDERPFNWAGIQP